MSTAPTIARTTARWSLAEIAALSGGRLVDADASASPDGVEPVAERAEERAEERAAPTVAEFRKAAETGGTGAVSSAVRGGAIGYAQISIDTRTLAPGDLFVALRGEIHDGHEWTEAAVARGASALFVDREITPTPAAMGRPETSGATTTTAAPPGPGDPLTPPSYRRVPCVRVGDTLTAWQRWGAQHRARWSGGPLIGITGSSGKTTTKNALAQLLSGIGPVWATSGNRNNHVGVPWTLLGLGEEHRFAVVEMGMNAPGEIALLSRLARPDLALVTSVGRAHIGRLGSREAILAAKLEIAEGLASGGTLVLPHDSWLLARLPEELAARPRLTFGLTPEADIHPLGEVAYGAEGTRFVTAAAGAIDLPLLGPGPVLSVLAALATAVALGLDVRALAPRLQDLRPEPLRMEPRLWGRHRVILDCYNASPESTRLAIDFLGALPHEGRKIFVLGELSELGDETAGIHRELVASIHDVDIVLLVGPAFEAIAEEAGRHPGAGQVVWRAVREEASTWLADMLREGDLVLLKASRRLALERILERPAPGPLSPAED